MIEASCPNVHCLLSYSWNRSSSYIHLLSYLDEYFTAHFSHLQPKLRSNYPKPPPHCPSTELFSVSISVIYIHQSRSNVRICHSRGAAVERPFLSLFILRDLPPANTPNTRTSGLMLNMFDLVSIHPGESCFSGDWDFECVLIFQTVITIW